MPCVNAAIQGLHVENTISTIRRIDIYTFGDVQWERLFFGGLGMKIIDVHAHIYPDAIAQRAADSIGDFYDIPMHWSGTVNELLVHGRAAGISQFVVCSAAVTPSRVRSVKFRFTITNIEQADQSFRRTTSTVFALPHPILIAQIAHFTHLATVFHTQHLSIATSN